MNNYNLKVLNSFFEHWKVNAAISCSVFEKKKITIVRPTTYSRCYVHHALPILVTDLQPWEQNKTNSLILPAKISYSTDMHIYDNEASEC